MSDHDLIFSAEMVRSIITDEMSALENLTLQEIQARIDHYQQTSREAGLRIRKASEELHKRLSKKDNDELEGLIEHVPSAERILVDRRGFAKPKPPNKAERVKAALNAMAKENPLMKQLRDELSAAHFKKETK